MTTKKPRTPIQETWVKSLLAEAYPRLVDARKEWVEALEGARKVLESNPLTSVVAQTVARESGRRGEATLILDDDGQVFLEVASKTTSDPPDKTKRKWHSLLPPLSSLRQEAEGLGLDTSQFGRDKGKLLTALQTVRAGRPKMARTAPAVGPVISDPDVDPAARS